LLLQMFVPRTYLDLKTKNQQILHTLLIAEILAKIKPTDPLRLVMQAARRKRTDQTPQEFLCREQQPPDGHAGIEGHKFVYQKKIDLIYKNDFM
jgi:hypothetical protein